MKTGILIFLMVLVLITGVGAIKYAIDDTDYFFTFSNFNQTTSHGNFSNFTESTIREFIGQGECDLKSYTTNGSVFCGVDAGAAGTFVYNFTADDSGNGSATNEQVVNYTSVGSPYIDTSAANQKLNITFNETKLNITIAAIDTNTTTICVSGDTTYLSADGNCNDLDARYLQNDSSSRLAILNITNYVTAANYRATGSGKQFNFMDNGVDLTMNLSDVDGEFTMEQDNTKLTLFNTPSAGNDFKVFQIFSREASDVIEFTLTKAGVGHHSFFSRSGGVGSPNFNCTTFANFVDCDTDIGSSATGADWYIDDELEVNGSIYLNERFYGNTVNNLTTLSPLSTHGFDFAHAAQSFYTLFIHPTNSTTDWIGIGYDPVAQQGVIDVGVGGFLLDTNVSIITNLSVSDDITADNVTLRNGQFYGLIDCTNITGGSDSDFCADASGGGDFDLNVTAEDGTGVIFNNDNLTVLGGPNINTSYSGVTLFVNLTDNVTLVGNLSVALDVLANNVTLRPGGQYVGNISCSDIIDGSDSDFCADATGGGGFNYNFTGDDSNNGTIFDADTMNYTGVGPYMATQVESNKLNITFNDALLNSTAFIIARLIHDQDLNTTDNVLYNTINLTTNLTMLFLTSCTGHLETDSNGAPVCVADTPDTNASTECAGPNEFLDSEGACIDNQQYHINGSSVQYPALNSSETTYLGSDATRDNVTIRGNTTYISPTGAMMIEWWDSDDNFISGTPT